METKKNENKDKLIANLGRVVTESTSAFMVWLGPVVREVGHGTLTFEYRVRKEMTNPLGTMHGGVMAAIMDDLIGATIISLGREYYYATINNAMDYLAPAKECDNIVGNIISGQVTGDTAKQLSERVGKIMQERNSVSINSNDTSVSKSTQLDYAVPASKISALSSGTFVGMVADNPDEKIELKLFHS